jgi:hypothetical protein
MFKEYKRKKSKLTQTKLESLILNKDKIHWRKVLKSDIVLDDAFLKKYLVNNFACIKDLIRFYRLNENVLEDVWHKQPHCRIECILQQDVSEGFFEKNAVKYNLEFKKMIPCFIRNQKFSEDFTVKHLDILADNQYICKNGKLSEGYIEKNAHKINWSITSRYQDLSEAFIEKYNKNVKWGSIFAFQALSPDFILKYKNKFVPNTKAKILKNKKIKKNAEFISKLGNLFNLSDLEIDSESALEIIKANRFKFDLDHFLNSADSVVLSGLAKSLVV